MEIILLEEYKKYLLYRDQNTYMFENEVENYNLRVVLNDYDIYIHIDKSTYRFTESKGKIFEHFVLGCYVIKKYYSNQNLLYIKLVWKHKDLKKYNQSVKYSFCFCKKINNIEVMQGIKW